MEVFNEISSTGKRRRRVGTFWSLKIGVITGIMESDPEKAVLSHLNGILATGSNICNH